MPQEHQVLRCFSCETFQVHIVKKAKKWDCKLCGAKQSLRRSYGKGSGKDCRNQVMKLNELQILGGNSSKTLKDNDIFKETFAEEFKAQELEKEKPSKSKWTEYLEENTASEGNESEETAGSLNKVVMIKKKRGKNPLKYSQNCMKKICTDFKKSTESFYEVHDEINPSFSDDEITDGSDKKNLCETKTQENIYEKYPIETNIALKHSKYAKYLDDDEDDDHDNSDSKQVNKNLNIFNSDLVDLDNILNF